ncbi:MAG TPA: Hpt domain-containing protein [Xanthobacteraceae bacterium]|nr:Hpt domain-containing protein [Xanthobacteraceae bacterium]
MTAAGEMQAIASCEDDPQPATPINLRHLTRMTLGDRGLEREVLQLFLRQSAMLLARLDSGDHASASVVAHTLKGSAKGIGAWRVAAAAEAVEVAAAREPDGLSASIAALTAAAAEARCRIDELLQAGRWNQP